MGTLRLQDGSLAYDGQANSDYGTLLTSIHLLVPAPAQMLNGHQSNPNKLDCA